MDTKKIIQWLRWPEKPGNNYRSWFVIIWMFPWGVLYAIGICISWVGIAFSYGLKEANEFWGDNI